MSSTSTPTKKRKMLSSTGSWKQVVRKIHGDAAGGILNLLPLLTEMEDYDAFITLKNSTQIILLKSVLGDDSPFVDVIMKILESTTTTSNIDKIQSCDIVPSHRFRVDELHEVFATIFDFYQVKFPDIQRFIKSLSALKTEFPKGTYKNSPSKYIDIYNDLDAAIVYNKELSLYPLLGLLAGSISNELENILQSRLMVEFDFNFVPNKSYAIDGAVVRLMGETRSAHSLPLILYELKFQVASRLEDQDTYSLSEFFIQAYYLATVYKHKFWHCLTDMTDFHYFQYQLNNGSLKVQKYHYLNTSDFDLTDHQNHVITVVNLFSDK